jgi:hypothetical protein
MKKLLLVAIFIAQSISAYELNQSALLGQCPLIHTDEFSFNGISNTVKAFLEKAITANQECQAPLNALSGSLSQINLLLTKNISPEQYDKISRELKIKELLKLEMELMTLTPTDYRYQIMASRIDSLRSEVLDHDISATYSEKYFTESSDNALLGDALGRMNEGMMAIANLPAICADQIGGLKQILPAMAAAAASVSGLDMFGGQALVGAALSLVSNLVSMLQDMNKKSALSALIKQNNSEILACTYFVNKHTACELKRALKFSKMPSKTLDQFRARFPKENVKEYDDFLFHNKLKNEFQEAFEVVGNNSAISIDVDLISQYLEAIRASPEKIKITIPAADAKDEEISSWLIAIKAKGIEVSSRNRGNGMPLSIKDQYTEAVNDIERKIATKVSVGAILKNRSSYVDLKHALEVNGNTKEKAGKMKRYFDQQLNNPLLLKSIGTLLEGKKIMDAFVELLSIEATNKSGVVATENIQIYIDACEGSKDMYSCTVNEAGNHFFKIMAENAIAQINSQTVLAIASKIQDRIDRVFRLIENSYLKQDLEGMPAPVVRFSDYKREKALEFQFKFNRADFIGSKLTGRDTKFEEINKALRVGFRTEILESIEAALNTKSEILSDAEGVTAAHYCAIYADLLKADDSRYSRRLLNTCKERFKTLELAANITPSDLPIQWDDPCFYSDYHRLENSLRDLQIQQKDIWGGR